jgi:hypothetical protein
MADSPDSFTIEDIRKLRDDFDRRYTDGNGNIDWVGATAEIEAKAARVRADIAHLRAERGFPIK